MKKILLATTILAASAGYASAEITWAGSAAMGVAQNGTANGGSANTATHGSGAVIADGAFASYSSANLAVTFAGESDSGLTFGATFDTTVGRSYTLGDGDAFANEGGAFGGPEVFVSGAFGKVSVKSDGYGFYHNDDDGIDQGDVKYEGTFNAFSVGIVADVEAMVTVGDLGSNNSLHLGYAANKITAGLNYDDNGDYDVNVGYALGTFTVSLGHDVTGAVTANSIKGAFDNGNGITASLELTDDSTVMSTDVTAGYAKGAMAVNLEYGTDDDAASVDTWTLTGSYDLGGGLSIEAGTNYTEDMMIGAKMTF